MSVALAAQFYMCYHCRSCGIIVAIFSPLLEQILWVNSAKDFQLFVGHMRPSLLPLFRSCVDACVELIEGLECRVLVSCHIRKISFRR